MIPLAENRFLQASKGAENTKEKSRRCFKGRLIKRRKRGL
jgi:predicted adenine nucleotide alpha hydrolase (AANH) superfamily ATPase